jgi:NAD(P) transhydrogenase subunit alpha
VLVIGAGVAGLAAIGTARGLGAIVRAFDTRLAVKEQVASMGGDFLELEFEESGEGGGGYAKQMSDEFLRKEMELFAAQAKDVDIIITTALIPGKPAPKLISSEMIASMRKGSVIVDMAAEQGGNCEGTQPQKKIERDGVTIIGYTDLTGRLPTQASRLYANNLVNLLEDLTTEKNSGIAQIDLENRVVRGCLITYQGDVMWPAPRDEKAELAQAQLRSKKSEQDQAAKTVAEKSPASPHWVLALGTTLIGLLLLLGFYAPESFLSHFTVFVLACFVGWQVVWNVTPALHSPLMSVTNAISGIILVGALLQVTANASTPTVILASIAIGIASINISGGFLVTQRMLSMFHR